MSVKDWGQFEDLFEERNDECAVWEAMCPDAVDGTLTAAEQRAFDRHIATCKHCAEELEQAQRGAAWLHMLKGHTPEPPASLMERILAETSGVSAVTQAEAAPAFIPEPDNIWTQPRQPVRQSSWLAAAWARTRETFRIDASHATFQPRFAMTAAMAFFSVALSLNLMGVRLRDVKNFSLRPSSLSRTVADASASAERNFQNLRVVYQLESRVSEIRQDNLPAAGYDDSQPFAAPEQAPDANNSEQQKQPLKKQ